MSEAKVRVRVAHNAMHLPVVALRGLVVFPNNVVHFEVGRQKSIAAIEAAMHANSNIFLIAQKDMETEEPTASVWVRLSGATPRTGAGRTSACRYLPLASKSSWPGEGKICQKQK